MLKMFVEWLGATRGVSARCSFFITETAFLCFFWSFCACALLLPNQRDLPIVGLAL